MTILISNNVLMFLMRSQLWLRCFRVHRVKLPPAMIKFISWMFFVLVVFLITLNSLQNMFFTDNWRKKYSCTLYKYLFARKCYKFLLSLFLLKKKKRMKSRPTWTLHKLKHFISNTEIITLIEKDHLGDRSPEKDCC